MTIPPVAAELTAEVVGALPARLRKRLDGVTEQAREWPVERDGPAVLVRVDEQNVVTLADPVAGADGARCSCLLSPRCLHLAAVLSIAPVLAAEPDKPGITPVLAAEPGEPGMAPLDVAAPTGAAVSAAQRAAAGDLAEVGAALLASGIAGGGAVTQAGLLRAVHQARSTGLYAPAAAAVRIVERLRAARSDEPAFRLADLHADLLELLTGCHRLATGDPGAAGTARRDYEPVGDLRLYGLFCEPVRAATGHAGAVTHLVDAGGRVWTVADVKPVGPAIVQPTPRSSVDLGEVRLSHHDLSRGGLLAINAHASATGRLSHGRARQAVTAPGVSWFESPLDDLWRVPLADQVDRWLQSATAAADLAHLDGVVLGADSRGLLLGVERPAITVAVAAPIEDPALPYVANLRALAAHAAGCRVRLAGRFTGPRRVAGLAFAAAWLPAHHGGHVDLGAVQLSRADLDHGGAVVPAPALAAGWQAPPLHLLRHHLERVVAAGRSVLLAGVDDDVRRLTTAQMSTAAAVLNGLGAAGVRRTRDVFGRLDPHDTQQLARAWLAAAVYEQSAGREITRSAWTV